MAKTFNSYKINMFHFSIQHKTEPEEQKNPGIPKGRFDISGKKNGTIELHQIKLLK